MLSQIFKILLWDFSEKNKNALPAELLIRRSLAYGGADALREILRSYGKNKVREIFKSMKNTEISARRFNYLQNYLLR